ncbi:MAG: hypothetical protein WDO74_23345 [Pseudomonadota bacterium]
MKYRPSLALTALAALGLGASLLVACGGRYQATAQGEDDPVSAGSSSGGSSSGGAPSMGRGGSAPARAGASGDGACNNVNCTTADCPAGSVPVLAPGACCATCESSCPPCPKVACGTGSHFEQPADTCCPICVDDWSSACQMGVQTYSAQRTAMLKKYSLGCSRSSECVTIAPVNLCEHGCSYGALWYGVADSFESNLSDAADMYCASCPQVPVPPCAPPPMARCINGQCQY